MINWQIGLSDNQKQLLEEQLKEEALIEPKYHKFIYRDEEIEIFGKLLPRNKLIREREYGYTYYIEENGVLKTYSAFHYKLITTE